MPEKEQKSSYKASSKPQGAKQATDHGDVLASQHPLSILTPAHVLQLQRTLGNRAVGTLISRERPRPVIAAPTTPIAQRKQPGNQVIQRVLGVGNDVQQQDVAAVTKVHNKVWVLRGHAGDSVVVKLELPHAETKGKFEARHAYVTWLAQAVLAGVPNAKVMTANEIAQLAQVQVQEGGGKGAPTLRSATAWNDMVFLKVETVAMGQSLEDRIADARAQGTKWGGRAQTRLEQLMTAPATLTELGKMAVFDLVVNNYDRFRSVPLGHDGLVNPKNIDFNAAGQAIAIDNLDPNHHIDVDDWPGENRVKDNKNRHLYAIEAVTDMMQKVGGIATDRATLAPLVVHFRAGMEQAVASLKQQAQLLRFKGLTDRGEKQQIGNILAARIDNLK